MAIHHLTWRQAISSLGILAAIACSAQIALGQYTFVQDTDNSASWASAANWLDGGSNTTFPNAAGATALINAPIRSGTGTGNYTLALQTTSITVGELKIDNTAFANNYNVNVTTGGATLTFQSTTSDPARYIETAGTSTTGSTRYTFNPVINVLSDWQINDDNVVYLNTGTTFSNIINGATTRTITKDGHGAIQFSANLSLLPGEGFEGQYVINQGGIRLIGTSAIIKSTGITVNSGGQLQLADNAATTLPDWNLASGAVLKLNGTGKATVPNITTADGALRIGITAGRTTTFHNPVELQSDSNISVAAATTFGVLDNVVSGPGDLVKTGAGKLTLSGSNTYTGDTQVTANILSISNPYLADGADVYMTTGAIFDLNFGANTDTIRSLYFDGIAQSVGTYGATGSGATNINDTFFTGSGVLNVTTLPVVGVPGDFNNNGTVDADDYVVWRKGGPLQNEVDTPGTVNAQDYLDWRARFGNPNPGSGSSLGLASVPEPATIALLAFVSPFIAPLVARRTLGRTRS